jgi:superfamily II DNA/RNA helicase
VNLDKPVIINTSDQGEGEMKMELIESRNKDKLDRLAEVLNILGNDSGIVFCNYKDSIQRVSNFLLDKGILHGCFYGGMEQQDRELSLTKFRNGSHKIIVATDLASRGLDVERINYIIHYHLPSNENEFIHRNGRTARMDKDGIVYVLKHHSDPSPPFIPHLQLAKFENKDYEAHQNWVTLMISGGRKDRISKGDVAGFLIKKGELKNDEVGLIELKQKMTFVAIEKKSSTKIVEKINGLRLKTKKIRATLV